MESIFPRALTAAFALLGAAPAVHAGALTIAQDGSGAYRSIQAAVDAARPYDTLRILDLAVYREQVTLRAPLHHVVLTTRDPDGPEKPVIRWRDTEHVGPRTCEEGLTEAGVDYDKNGALRLLGVRDVTVEGLAVEGDSAFAFGRARIWPAIPGNCATGTWDFFSGNAALVLNHCANIRVRRCRLSRAYFGAYIKERDDLAPFREMRTSEERRAGLVMALGNHSFTGNVFRHSTWGVGFESAWGLGSTFRDNLFWENHHADSSAAAAVYALPDGEHQAGGAFVFKDVPQSAMAIVNNTFARNYVLFAGLDNSGGQHLIANNVFARPWAYWSSREAGPYGSPFMDHSPFMPRRMKYNVFATQLYPPARDSVTLEAAWLDTSTGMSHIGRKIVTFHRYVTIMNGLSKPQVDANPDSIDVDAGPRTIRLPGLSGTTRPGALLTERDQNPPFTAEDGNRWLETGFVSADPASVDFLRPADSVAAWLRAGWAALGYRTRAGSDAGLGAVPAADRPAELRVVPIAPALASPDSLSLRFTVSLPGGSPASAGALRVQYCRLVRKLPGYASSLGGGTYGPSERMLAGEAEALSLEGAAVQPGFNELRLPWPGAARDTLATGFVELAVQGGGGYSNVAQFPILPAAPFLRIEILDDNALARRSAARTGISLRIRITARDGSPFRAPLRLGTASGAPLEVLEASDTARDSAGSYLGSLPLTFRVALTGESRVEMLLAGAWDAALGREAYGASPPILVPENPVGTSRDDARRPAAAAGIAPRRDALGRALDRAGRGGSLLPIGPRAPQAPAPAR